MNISTIFLLSAVGVLAVVGYYVLLKNIIRNPKFDVSKPVLIMAGSICILTLLAFIGRFGL